MHLIFANYYDIIKMNKYLMQKYVKEVDTNEK